MIDDVISPSPGNASTESAPATTKESDVTNFDLMSSENEDPLDFSSKYNTQLSPEDEAAFKSWAQAQSKAVGRDLSQDTYDYDLRGWWQQNRDASLLADAHLTDSFKKPNHPTFSTQSQYHGKDDFEGGEWLPQPNGAWNFRPGSTNLSLHGAEALRDYFSREEPNSQLLLPP